MTSPYKSNPNQTPQGGCPAACHPSLPFVLLSFPSTFPSLPFSPPCSAAGGEIFDQCVADNDEAFTEKDVIRLARQILNGVAFLHRNNVVHLDLKVSLPSPTSRSDCALERQTGGRCTFFSLLFFSFMEPQLL